MRLWLATLVTVVSLGLPIASAAPATAATGCAPLQSGASQAAQAAVQVACRYVGQQYAWGGGGNGISVQVRVLCQPEAG
ncbi:hypothetical protein AB0D62_21770 [Streptomyces massasporeus]|uniref:hypothetical protein n=1 Tax=Streptomyces massasporeus TaxID=67324 RepID=UPI0033D2DE17